MASFPNSERLSADVKAFVDFYHELLDSSRAQAAEEALKGIRTIQITEFLNAASIFAETVPVEGDVGLPTLPATPDSWTIEHVQLAVRYIYGVNATISEADSERVIAQLVEDYNADNIPISWSGIQDLLGVMVAEGEIVIETEPVL